jgi:hypothetical protein
VILKVDKWRSKCAGEGMLIIGKRGRNDGGYFKPPTINTYAGHADVTVTFLAFKVWTALELADRDLSPASNRFHIRSFRSTLMKLQLLCPFWSSSSLSADHCAAFVLMPPPMALLSPTVSGTPV